MAFVYRASVEFTAGIPGAVCGRNLFKCPAEGLLSPERAAALPLSPFEFIVFAAEREDLAELVLTLPKKVFDACPDTLVRQAAAGFSDESRPARSALDAAGRKMRSQPLFAAAPPLSFDGEPAHAGKTAFVRAGFHGLYELAVKIIDSHAADPLAAAAALGAVSKKLSDMSKRAFGLAAEAALPEFADPEDGGVPGILTAVPAAAALKFAKAYLLELKKLAADAGDAAGALRVCAGVCFAMERGDFAGSPRAAERLFTRAARFRTDSGPAPASLLFGGSGRERSGAGISRMDFEFGPYSLEGEGSALPGLGALEDCAALVKASPEAAKALEALSKKPRRETPGEDGGEAAQNPAPNLPELDAALKKIHPGLSDARPYLKGGSGGRGAPARSPARDILLLSSI
jgi:hypothetical protein